MDLLALVNHSAVSLAARTRRGGPAGDWTEAEAVLAMVILMFEDPSRLSGTRLTKHGEIRQHPAVTAAALAVGRTEDAVVLKVMNLRAKLTQGGRGMAHVAKVDEWVVEAFADHLDLLVLAGESVAGLVPYAGDVMSGLGRALTATDPEGGTETPVTSAMAHVVLRRGQGLFHNRVLANYAHSCAFCGLRSRIPDRPSHFLIAGHILPWQHSTPHSRLDAANGLSLCANHDRAFEWGFVTVDEDLRVVTSPGASEHYEPEERVRREILDLHGTSISRDSRYYVPPGKAYLDYHRSQVFDRRFRASQRT